MRFDSMIGFGLTAASVLAALPALAQVSFQEVDKLLASDGVSSDFFGYSVSVSGGTAVVGAYGEGLFLGEQRGAAYVFESGESGWSEVKKLTAFDAAGADHFGWSVAISGDLVVIGADGDNNENGNDAGSAYIFSRNQGGVGNWVFVKKLLASDGSTAAFFGRSVAIEGEELVVGADGDVSNTGAAYLFRRNQGGSDNWGEVRKLTASDAAAGDRFGVAVGFQTDAVVAGAPGDEAGQGAAYVFERDQGGADNWGEVRKLTAPDGAASDAFGHAVAIGGDAAVVGAPWDDTRTGSAHVYLRDQGGAGNWGWLRKLTASDAVGFAEFGQSVASDGTTTAVGAWKMDGQAGAVYVFERNAGGPGTWAEVQKLSTSDAAAFDFFGFSVSLSRPVIFGGAHGDDDNGNNAGAAYAFRLVSVSLPSLTGWGLALCAVAMLACTWRSRRPHRT